MLNGLHTDQFFSSVLISDSYFQAQMYLQNYLKDIFEECYTRTNPFDQEDESTHMRFLWTKINTNFKGFDKGVDSDEHLNLDSLLPQDGQFWRVNKYMVIPVFDFLGGFDELRTNNTITYYYYKNSLTAVHI